MKAASEIIEMFEQFPKTEFDTEAIIIQSYASDSSTRRALKGLCASGFLVYRYVETAKTAKKIYRLKSAVTELLAG